MKVKIHLNIYNDSLRKFISFVRNSFYDKLKTKYILLTIKEIVISK